jgi:DNA processing protein
MSAPPDRPVLRVVGPDIAPDEEPVRPVGAGSQEAGSTAAEPGATAGASPLLEREAWAVLLAVHGLGPAGFGALLAAHGTGRAILAAAGRRGAAARFARIAAEGDGRPAFRDRVGEGIVAVAAELGDRLAVLRASGVEIVTLDDPGYPQRLRAIDLPPPVLLVRGDPAALRAEHTIAIVGTRRPTERGRLVAARIAAALVRAGAVVISGLAVGIDGAAHAAVTAEHRPTVAVLGSGHGRLFPRAHERLAREILSAGGAIVSELWPDQPPSKHTFPQRNRVISGLADATIVVEAGVKSGALITARWALEQGRGLFLVPGPIEEPRSAGCLAWLREYPGEARIVAGIPELVTDLELVDGDGDATAPPTAGPASRSQRPGLEAVLVELGATARAVGAALVAGYGSLDELVVATGHEPATVLGAITLLELRGLATTTYGRYRAAGQLASATAPEVRSMLRPRLPVRPGPC